MAVAKAARRNIDKARRAATSKRTATVAAGDIVVRADPAGAANLMRDIVALHDLDVALEEHDGHWQVVVRAEDDPESTLARLVAVTAECVERGRMGDATVCFGSRSYTIHEGGDGFGSPACAA